MKARKEIEKLFREHYAEMYRLAQCILYDSSEAEDVVSDIFKQLLEEGTTLIPNTSRHYLLRAVRNRCLNIISHKSVRERVEKTLLTQQQIANDDVSDERWQQLSEAIDHLEPPIRRLILTLRYHEEMSYEEVARHLGVSKVTVYNHLSKAINTLRETFKSVKHE